MAGKLGPSELLVYGGANFYRYPEAEARDKRVYFYSRQLGYLHRVIWAEAHGPIPPDHEIHHADHDTFNNDLANLVCVPRPEHRRESAESRVFQAHTCDHCGAVFESQAGVRGERRFCSGRCSQAYNRASGRYRVESTCPVCHSLFTTNKYRPSTYCSNRCHAATRTRETSGTFRRL